ncbi:MAG: thioredoxin [Candidatus Geothermarchaeales archaeon]
MRYPKEGRTVHVDDGGLDEITGGYPLVFVEFWAPWCGPCRVIGPVIDSLAEENSGGAVFVKVNVDENRRKAAEFGVQSIPTILIFKEGKAVNRLVGAVPRRKLEEKIELYSS